MGIEYYGFTFFIFVLVCLVLLLCKFLFSNVKRQNKLLDEKETKLLKLYQTVEDAMEELYDQTRESKDEIKKLGDLHIPKEEIEEALPPKPEKKSKTIKPPKKTPPPPPPILPFQHMIDELVENELELEQSEMPMPVNNRNAAVLRLRDEGKGKTQIAEELGITLNEVELVLGLNGDKSENRL